MRAKATAAISQNSLVFHLAVGSSAILDLVNVPYFSLFQVIAVQVLKVSNKIEIILGLKNVDMVSFALR